MKNNVSKSVSNYLDSKDELAFQIDGQWGTGKTYYIQHDLIDIIAQRKSTGKAANTLVYFSVNGMKSMDELKTALNRSLLATYRTEKGDKYDVSGKLGHAIEIFTEAKVPLIDNAISVNGDGLLKELSKFFINKANFSDYVIVFDDLERISEKLDITEVLGYIADIQNKWNCKIIVISDETKESEENIEKLKTRKEKVINKRIEFGNNSTDVALSLIREDVLPSVNVELHEWVMNAAREFITMLDGQVNLRTIKSSISSFLEISKAVNDNFDSDDVITQSLKTGFITTFIITNCYKSGRFILDEKEMGALLTNKVSNLGFNLALHKKDNSIVSYMDKTFHSKHSVFFEDLLYTIDVIDLVEREKFEVEHYLNTITNVMFENREDNKFIERFSNFRYLNEKQLTALEGQAVAFVRLHDSNFQFVFDIYSALIVLKERKLFFLKCDLGRIYTCLTDSISQMNESQLEGIEMKILYSEIADKTEFLNAINAQKDWINNRDDTNMLEKIFESNWREANRNKQFFKHNSIFSMILKSDDLKQRLLQDGIAIDGLNRYIYSEMVHISNAREYHSHETQSANDLIKFIDNQLMKVNNLDRVIKFDLLELKDSIQQAIKNIS